MPADNFSFFAVLAASLIGSPHCAGMCGGFVAFCSAKAARPFSAQAGYNGGRLLSYIGLGVTAGLAGVQIDHWGAFTGLQQCSAVLTGALLIYWGLRSLFAKPLRQPAFTPYSPNKIPAALFSRLLRNDDAGSWPLRSFCIGALSVFLPCGWLYGFVALAAGSGSPLNGALLMSAFWLGSLPILTSVGLVFETAGAKLQRLAPQLTAILLIAAGMASLSGRIYLNSLTGKPSCHAIIHQ